MILYWPSTNYPILQVCEHSYVSVYLPCHVHNIQKTISQAQGWSSLKDTVFSFPTFKHFHENYVVQNWEWKRNFCPNFKLLNFSWELRLGTKTLPSQDEPGLGIQPIHRTCCMMNSLVLCCFPLLYFYNLLYYTDVGSVLFVLSSYSCSIRKHHAKAAMVSSFNLCSFVFWTQYVMW